MTGPEPRAGRREWIGLLVLALPCVLYSMDLTVLNLAVPRLSADLAPTSSELLWIVDIYGFLVAGSLITMGTLGTDTIVSAARPEQAGAAAAISESSSELGGSLGIAILGSIGTAIYRRGVVAAIPDGVPPGTTEAAQSTLAGALEVSARLPAELGARVLHAAEAAFTRGLAATAIACAVVALAAAVVVGALVERRAA